MTVVNRNLTNFLSSVSLDSQVLKCMLSRCAKFKTDCSSAHQSRWFKPVTARFNALLLGMEMSQMPLSKKKYYLSVALFFFSLRILDISIHSTHFLKSEIKAVNFSATRWCKRKALKTGYTVPCNRARFATQVR